MEVRGEICVIHCGGIDGGRLASELPDEVERCLVTGASAVVVDLDPWGPMDDEGLDGASRRRDCVRSRRAARWSWPWKSLRLERHWQGPGSCARCLPAPGPPEGDDDGPLRAGARPRWEHEFTFPATTRQLRAARRRVAAFAEVAGLDEADLFELSVAVAEALANAVVHGSPHGADDDVRVRFFCYEDEVAVEVVDSGEGMAATPICAAPDVATSGRGIHFMRALADAVHYTCGPFGTRVLLVKKRS